MRPFLILLLLVVLPVGAETLRIDVAELAEALNASESVGGDLNTEPLEALTLALLQRQLEQAELRFDQGELIFQRAYQNRLVEGGCNNTTVRDMLAEIRLLETSALAIEISSLSQPLSVRLRIQAELTANGRARQEFGIRLGDCQPLASDSFDFRASGVIDGELEIQLSLNPQTPALDVVRFAPTLAVSGQLSGRDIRVQIEDSVLRNLLEDFIEDEIRDALAPGVVEQQLEALQQSLQDRLAAADAATIDLQLPDPDDEQIASLYRLLAGQSRLPLTVDYLRDNRVVLLVALLTGDQQAVGDLLTDAAGCGIAQTLQVELARQPLYTLDAGRCLAVDPAGQSAQFFADALCQQPIDFQTSDFGDYCEIVLDRNALGNAAARPGQLGQWMLSAGNTLDVSALSIAGLQQPYVQRLRYKTTATDRGVCELEMRIYSPHPAVRDRRAVLALHGGSWQYRPTGFVGLEVMATHLTNAGYVVFAPFYRLLGERDGPMACNSVQLRDVVDDGEDALDWVLANGDQFGASGAPVLFGQSAGAHLAARLAVSRASDIARAALLYGPVDFADFIDNLQSGQVESDEALGIIETVANAPLAALSRDTPVVAANSLPQMVAAGQVSAPLFLLHGEMDDIVPFSQSVRLCNALSGDAVAGPAPFSANLISQRRVIACDASGSTLHLHAQGEHAMDICIAQGICASGDPAGAQAAADSISDMLVWMAPDAQPVLSADDSAGGGGAFVCWLIPIALLGRWRRRRLSMD